MIGEESTDEPGEDPPGSLRPRIGEVEIALEDGEELVEETMSSGAGSGIGCSAGVAMPSQGSGSGRGANLIRMVAKSFEDADEAEETTHS